MTDVRDDLRRLDEALDAFREESGDLIGVQLMRESLERHRAELLAQLADQQLDLSLTRTARRGTGGELKLVAAVLAALQDSLASIAQTFAGRPTTRGLIPSAVSESVELRVAAAAPGSLQLILVPAYPETQVPLFDDAEDSPLDLSVLRLGEVLDGASSGADAVLEQVKDIGPRATAHIATLAKVLTDSEAAIAMNWRSPRHHRAVHLDVRTASTLQRTLAEVEEEERNVVFTGRLVGGSLIRATFELELDDGTVVRGSVDDGILLEVESLFGAECVATLSVRQIRLKGGETKEAHRLIGLTA